MKLSIILLVLAAVVFSSCSTAYRTGQTPDDVYYSPTRPAEEYVSVEKQNDRYYRGSANRRYDRGYDQDYYEDRFLRMRLQNRYRWSALDDYYFHNAYAYNSYGYYNNWYSPWNSYWAWNSYYNPYNPFCGGLPYYYYPGSVIVKNPRNYTPPSRSAIFNPNSYINTGNASRSSGVNRINNSYNNNNTRYNNRNSNSNRNSLGESMRKVFSNSNNNNNNSYQTPSRTYNPSNNNSSSSSSTPSRSSSSGSSGGGSSRPPR